MCFFLNIASPLTLSEIRSMLPSGLTADLAPAAERARLSRVRGRVGDTLVTGRRCRFNGAGCVRSAMNLVASDTKGR